MIEQITRLPLRQIWKHEAHDFTTWLTDNIEVLHEVVGFEISNAMREQSTGNFNVDIKAEDETGETVIIENQLTKSDHDHLGKIITYLAAFEAKKAVWIVSEPRQEHINAINWLNEGGNDCNFYLLKIEAIKIGNSNPAPLFTRIVGPSEEAKQIGKIKKEDSERHRLRFQFWTQLLEVAKQKHNLFNSISPTKDTWVGVTAGKKGLVYSFWLNNNDVRIQLQIDQGKDSELENLRIFNAIKTHQVQIEADFGEPLDWDEVEGSRMCAIRKRLSIGGLKSPETEWPQIIETVTDKMVALEKATKSIVKKLKV
jgi:hypothetical protein